VASFDALLLVGCAGLPGAGSGEADSDALEEMLRPGGVVFAMFHSKKPKDSRDTAWRIQAGCKVLSAKPICTAQKVYQNREIQGLFGNCRTIKTFIGRDQLRETLFLK